MSYQVTRRPHFGQSGSSPLTHSGAPMLRAGMPSSFSSRRTSASGVVHRCRPGSEAGESYTARNRSCSTSHCLPLTGHRRPSSLWWCPTVVQVDRGATGSTTRGSAGVAQGARHRGVTEAAEPTECRPDVRLLPRRLPQLRRRPGRRRRGPGDLPGHRRRRPDQPALPAPGRALRRRAGRTPVPGHRRRPAHPGQRARGGAGGGTPTPGWSTSTTTRSPSRTPAVAAVDGPAPLCVQGDLRRPDELLAHPTCGPPRPGRAGGRAAARGAALRARRRRPVRGGRHGCATPQCPAASWRCPTSRWTAPAELPTEQGTAVYRRSSAPLVPRSRAEVAALLRRVRPGRAGSGPGWPDWRPDGEPQLGVSHGYGGVGVRR